ncbi:glycerol-3-phosphate acyltransferase [Geminocystis sp. GBBB08]|uniref:glycerol-3-phosphate acyltransferase n=1 Tax=Geminocystis sp. GBBB08 TaxID=2604140 RepID=UPI0027E27A5F|nr:glycerol-3-phosphate acyltransferase [Geminocystis sp. GBBB08]MBL1209791.1 pyruvate phosphate dikinase PEP/pyruvate-binding protein [Geminocystis sp. GBBB08]
MTITQLWGVLLILFVCPIIGAIPLIDWFTYAVSGKQLTKLGTGNISVSAAFYHGGKSAGILAVLSEAGKGIAVVLLTRAFFPLGSTWEIVAIIALVIGRYWGGKGAGATNVTWGIIIHNPVGALLIFLIGGVSFTLWREKHTGRVGILVLMVVILSAQRINELEYIFMTVALASLLIGIYQRMPDDLDLQPNQVNRESAKMFRFFRGDYGILSLNESLNPSQVGTKAANLSLLKKWGYNVPDGWVIKAGDDIGKLTQFLQPSTSNPLVVRSSALDEDSINASAAGIYESFLHIKDTATLQQAIINCLSSYNSSIAINYRQSKQKKDKGIAVIIQQQINGIFSGVAFSRDPVNQLEDCVCIETVAGMGLQLVSGEITPQQYKVNFPDETLEEGGGEEKRRREGGEIPSDVLITIAKIAREIENICKGIPQDIEWTYDGDKIWLLQTRPITTLQPLWTRKIAAEVIPGVIKSLTWSINQPLTCGVWGDIFTIVLGKKAKNLDFNQTATLHYHRAYFNATLLGDIFLLMGLPPESLEFLTRGSKFTKPPLMVTVKNWFGLWRLLKKELQLDTDFIYDNDRYFVPILDELKEINLDNLSPQELLSRINNILENLKKATYYSILAPLSYSLRQEILKVSPDDLDNDNIPEIASLKTLKKIATDTRKLIYNMAFPILDLNNYAAFFAYLAESTEGESVLNSLDDWLNKYGYLSQVATDISIPRWRENAREMKIMFTKFVGENPTTSIANKKVSQPTWQIKTVQKRLNLKGKITEIYSQLLAELRYSFLALEKQWLRGNILAKEEDIFFLTLGEITNYIEEKNHNINLMELIQERQFQWQESKNITSIPYLIYGKAPQMNLISKYTPISTSSNFTGIGASAGIIEGKIKIVSTLAQANNINRETIIVVPYTDSGWTTILAQAGGIIAEVGGKLSHGAIIAREYEIPAVMDIHHATQIFQDGQLVRLNGSKGTVQILA